MAYLASTSRDSNIARLHHNVQSRPGVTQALGITQVTHASSPNATPRTNHATKPYLFCGTLGSS